MELSQRSMYMVHMSIRSSACVPAVAGTHAPGRGEGVEGLERLLGDIITGGQLLSLVEGSKDNRKWWKRRRHTRSGLAHK